MKTFLAVIGAIGVVVVILIVAGSLWVYKKSDDLMVHSAESSVNRYIDREHPDSSTQACLQRALNAAKLQKESKNRRLILSAILGSLTGNKLTVDRRAILDKLSTESEKGELSAETLHSFQSQIWSYRNTAAAPSVASSPAYGEKYNEQALKNSTPIKIRLKSNFQPVLLNSTNGYKYLYYSNKPGTETLTNQKPANIRKLPQFHGESQRYGSLQLGTAANNKFNFVFDLVKGPHPVLYFDFNQNLDLTDDRAVVVNEGTGIFAATIEVPFLQLFPGLGWSGNAEIWLYTNDSQWPMGLASHYVRNPLIGHIEISGKSHVTYLAEAGIHDLSFTNCSVNIDLNDDGKIDRVTESFYPGKPAEINGVNYRFDISW
jgi:hypothetical protein